MYSFCVLLFLSREIVFLGANLYQVKARQQRCTVNMILEVLP